MWEYRVAYRFPAREIDGWMQAAIVEGFCASALNPEGAQQHVLDRIREKCQRLGVSFQEEQLITLLTGLSAKEKAQVKADWQADRLSGY